MPCQLIAFPTETGRQPRRTSPKTDLPPVAPSPKSQIAARVIESNLIYLRRVAATITRFSRIDPVPNLSDDPAPNLSDDVLASIRRLASRAYWRFARLGYTRQDLVQEMVLHFLRHRHQHNAARGSTTTFATHICRNRLSNLYKAECAEKRGGAALNIRSLSEPMNDNGRDEPREIEDTISYDSYAIRLSRASRCGTDLLMLRLDVDRATAKLPPDLAQIAELLSRGVSVTDLVEILRLSRPTVHRRLGRLRQILSDAGLCNYNFKSAGIQCHAN